jgi:NADPH2:quinone reductase
MARAIRIHETGGPEVMRLEEVAMAAPGQGEARLRIEAAGVNYIDVYHRSGVYPLPLPTGLGVEAAGVVEAVGPGVEGLRAGDRVAAMTSAGSYAEARVLPADRLVKLPPGVDAATAVALYMKGLTAHMLLTRVHPVRAGETILVTAAAGGVGQVVVQWAAALGARVIGVTGSAEKAEKVRRLGAAHALVLGRDDLPARVKELTGGAGVPVAYDSVGKATFDAVLDCLAPFGLMVTYGNASGVVPPLAPAELGKKGSLGLWRPSVFHHVARRADLVAAADAVFALLAEGRLDVEVGGTFPLAGAAEAHRALESRRTTGSLVLLP